MTLCQLEGESVGGVGSSNELMGVNEKRRIGEGLEKVLLAVCKNNSNSNLMKYYSRCFSFD